MTDQHHDDPVADDIARRSPETDDVVAGEQVLDGDLQTGQRPVAPHPDDFRGEGAAPQHERDSSAAATGSGGSTEAAASTEQEKDRAERHA